MRGQKGSRRAQVSKSSLGHGLHYITACKIKLFGEEEQKLFLVFFSPPSTILISLAGEMRSTRHLSPIYFFTGKHL